ncbi:hypothetical protein [Stenotrophomonas maltophilia]|uniref:hypothetical protein n=1 Tax=Stenotrophomonas maltophilia TaxID=40324 RepID=UPI0005B6F6AC|nr:hypothetical protein [Stenotrophomonas maltophilia]KIS38437.1 hypothetical protein WJ66_00439 [Stenotrophomonas maltophilia WJ66]MCF3460802.1 hypothetical protein [Stenotrophomonas maltophilia]MCF3517737.1 hypothetical protein [Stenotrophomonas maltophilia]
MSSRTTFTADLRALVAVVTVIARNQPNRNEFREQVIQLVRHHASTLPPQEQEEMLQAAKYLIEE